MIRFAAYTCDAGDEIQLLANCVRFEFPHDSLSILGELTRQQSSHSGWETLADCRL